MIVSCDDFENIKTALEDYEDLVDLRAGISADDGERVSSVDIKSMLGL